MNSIEVLDIKKRIHTIRGKQVMLDSDLAQLYDVLTKNLNKAVKRNIKRFPKEFMFQLTENEFSNLKFHFGTSKSSSLRFQSGTLKQGRGQHRKYLPFVFTEQGVAMLSGILNSEIAIKVSIQIMHAFVIMRKFLLKNAEIFNKLNSIEKNQFRDQMRTDQKIEQIFQLIESKEIKPEKGIFFDGQIFDAYKFVSNLIRSAKESIILVDNYVDDSVLTFFSKRDKGVKVVIYTKNITKQLQLDLEKHNPQYEKVKVKEFKLSHDRFLIIDNKVYHFGASLKDLGKKWFAFSEFENESFNLLEKLRNS